MILIYYRSTNPVFYSSAQNDTHKDEGYASTAYGMSKVGVTVMTPIQQNMLDKEFPGKDVVLNSVSQSNATISVSWNLKFMLECGFGQH